MIKRRKLDKHIYLSQTFIQIFVPPCYNLKSISNDLLLNYHNFIITAILFYFNKKSFTQNIL